MLEFVLALPTYLFNSQSTKLYKMYMCTRFTQVTRTTISNLCDSDLPHRVVLCSRQSKRPHIWERMSELRVLEPTTYTAMGQHTHREQKDGDKVD